MGRGRPPKGVSHVDSLPGDDGTKAQMKAILETITGRLTVAGAAQRIGVSESRFHELRRQALLGMQEGLAPRPKGRPRTRKEPSETEDLRARLAWLEEELEISRLRTEIALWKPSLLRDPGPARGEKKGSSPKRRPRSRQRSGGGRSGT